MEFKTHELMKKIQERIPELSKGHRLIANFIINHYEKAAFMTAAKLGEAVGVSESTVVRFATEMGYAGYPKLQRVLQELIRSKLTSVQRIEVSSSRINDENVLKSVLESDLENLENTIEEIDQENFNKIVDVILSSKKIYILGVRSSAALASFLGFYFNLIFDNVRLVHTTSVSEMFEQVMKAGEGDVVIGISFPRYSRRTIKAMQFVKSQGATVIAITDSRESPVASCADHSLTARSDMASFVDSLVAPLSVINALIVAIGAKKRKDVYETFDRLEKIWEEYQIYEPYEHVENIDHYKRVD